MREMKFRAWDIEHNEMFFVDSITFHLSHDVVRVWKDICEPFGGLGIDPKTGILMQWTGLLDKNNTEIYEGDVVAYNVDGTNEKIWINEIIWKNGCLIIENEEVPPFIDNNIYNIKVIGNIYENPEMLEGNK